MGDQNYKIVSFKENANYDCWSENIREIFTLDHCQLITIGKKTLPKIPHVLSKEKAALFNNNIVITKAVVNTKLAKDVYKIKMERYEEEFLECNNKYSQTYAIIQLNYEDGFYVHIKGVENPHKI